MDENKTIHIEYGHTLHELQSGSHWDNECWDFDVSELFDGSVEPQDGMTYWLIGGRLYETKTL